MVSLVQDSHLKNEKTGAEFKISSRTTFMAYLILTPGCLLQTSSYIL